MLWTAGQIVADADLKVSVLDRAFEHGLGLFETLRTWDGHASLLERHLARLTRSAKMLRIPLERDQLPDRAAVRALHEVSGIEGDVLLRITLSGRLTAESGSTLWMRAGPLPEVLQGGAKVGGFWRVDADDPLARHKTLNYWHRRLAYEKARAEGLNELLSLDRSRCIWEGSRTNLFLVMAGGWLVSPTTDGPIVPGILRQAAIEQGRAIGLDVRDEGTIQLGLFDMKIVTEAFLTNSVRGIVPVATLLERKMPAPGPVTSRLRDHLDLWLRAGGEST